MMPSAHRCIRPRRTRSRAAWRRNSLITGMRAACAIDSALFGVVSGSIRSSVATTLLQPDWSREAVRSTSPSPRSRETATARRLHAAACLSIGAQPQLATAPTTDCVLAGSEARHSSQAQPGQKICFRASAVTWPGATLCRGCSALRSESVARNCWRRGQNDDRARGRPGWRGRPGLRSWRAHTLPRR